MSLHYSARKDTSIMDKTQFWQLIKDSRQYIDDDDIETACYQQAEQLQVALAKLGAPEIVAFRNIFDEFADLAYRWDLWAAAHIINGGASDDGFTYFRWWLIAQGQGYYEAALEDVESAGDTLTVDNEAECEMIAYCIGNAYEEKTGAAIPNELKTRQFPAEPAGERWNEEDLEELYPRLWAKFG